MFNDILFKKKDSAAMESHLGPAMANVFLLFYEMKWFGKCPNELKPVFCRRYVDDNQLNISQNFMHILIHAILICFFHLNSK